MALDPALDPTQPRMRALEATLRPLLDLFEAACGTRAAFRATVHGATGGAGWSFTRDSGLVREPVGTAVPAAHASAGLHAPDGAWLGTLDACALQGATLPPQAPEVLAACARVVALVLAWPGQGPAVGTAPASSSRATALLDSLTGLPNRQALALELDRMLARAQRDDMTVFVVCLGLRGDDAGDADVAFDRRVAELAACLSDAVRGGDLVARTGRHEFAVAGSIPRSTAEASVAVVLERLGRHCGRIAGTATQRMQLEIGFALATIGAYDAEALLAEAEAGLVA